jgi:hypothetical protein
MVAMNRNVYLLFCCQALHHNRDKHISTRTADYSQESFENCPLWR